MVKALSLFLSSKIDIDGGELVVNNSVGDFLWKMAILKNGRSPKHVFLMGKMMIKDVVWKHPISTQ